MRRRGVWRNWAGTVACRPRGVLAPASEEEVAAAVREAAARGVRVKAAGAGHSFTGIAATDGCLLRLDRLRGILSADAATGEVTVGAGIRLRDLNDALAARGLALENLGDIDTQSLAGAIATATHGTGIRFGTLSSQVTALRLVAGDGTIFSLSVSDVDPDPFQAARVSVGALGIVTAVTLRCVPAFRLHAVAEGRQLEEILADLDRLVDGSDHVEFFWLPHTDRALLKRNIRTDQAPAPRPRAARFADEILLQNGALALAGRLGRLRPAWIPAMARLGARALGRTEEVARSDRVFASRRLVRFSEMEYALPREAARSAVERLRRLIDEAGLQVAFPVEVRFVAADEALLSPSAGRESCYVAIHLHRGHPAERYFRAAEEIFRSLGGRPHWGKMHFLSSADLAPLYPAWKRFRAVRRRLDPTGVFANRSLDRVLGRP